MILVIGGTGQGKRAFAGNRLSEGAGPREIPWTDGAAADWDQFLKGAYCMNFHLFIRRLMTGEVSFKGVGGPEGSGHEPCGEKWCEAKSEILVKGLINALMEENPNRILVTDEIGYGIVPVDVFERRYREEAGRICCQAAREAAQVWRVCCGLGQRIK